MPKAEFEEKEFESAFNIELSGGTLGKVFPAGQVLEALVGYDAVASPDTKSVVWRILSVPRPKGVRLTPPMWAPGALPSGSDLPNVPISLVLQYKGPEYLYGSRAKQWSYWRSPYYRFKRITRQHTVLRRLERALNARAIVRYTAPTFWKRSELEAAFNAGSVIQRSGFVSPQLLGHHKVWTYQAPGNFGRANPNGRRRRILFEDASVLRNVLEEVDSAQDLPERSREALLLEHLRVLRRAAEDRQPALREALSRWQRSVEEVDIQLQTETLNAIRGIAAITSLMTQLGGSWHLTGL